jgi:hypothetical protein
MQTFVCNLRGTLTLLGLGRIGGVTDGVLSRSPHSPLPSRDAPNKHSSPPPTPRLRGLNTGTVRIIFCYEELQTWLCYKTLSLLYMQQACT